MTDLPDFSSLFPNINVPISLPRLSAVTNPLVTHAEANFASAFHSTLVEWITRFDASLDPAHEVGVRLVNFGQAVVFHLEAMSSSNPSLISFTGTTEDGKPVQLIQHVSQISVLLTKVPRNDPDAPKRPIGFGEAGK